MSIQDKCNRLQAMAGAYWASRGAAELQYAANLSAAQDGKYDAPVNNALDFLLSEADREGAVTKAAVLAAEQQLSPLWADAKRYRVRCVGHAHIDMNWMWGVQETAALTVDTFRTVLELMEEYPDFTFAQSQASTYELIEQYAPELLPAIRARIREGRWEVSASTWVENDKNMPNGESMARHILYTKRYLSRLLDIPMDAMQLDFEPDTFGHCATVPEILCAGGVKYYYHCRGQQGGPSLCRWESDSGKSILVYREPNWYNAACAPDMFKEVPLFCRDYGVDVMLKVFGVGDHGGGPTRRDLECLQDVMTWPLAPTVTYGTYHGFFRELEQYGDRLPTVKGERNFVFTGCYTTQSRIKMANRVAEARLYEAEALSAAASLCGGTDDAKAFAGAWQKTLFNQFHDILPGSGTVETREFAMGRFQESMAVAQVRGGAAMRVLGDAIDTSAFPVADEQGSIAEGAGAGYRTDAASRFSLPQTERGRGKNRVFHLFNTTQFDFDGVTEITAWDWQYDKSRAVFADDKGQPTASQLLADRQYYWDHWCSRFAVRVRVPAFGYATYTLTEKGAATPDFAGVASLRQDTYGDTDIVLENEHLRAVFSRRTAELLSLTDKATGKEQITAPAGRLLWITENTSEGMTAWRVGNRMKVEAVQQTRNVHMMEVVTGGVRQWLHFDLPVGERSHLDVTVSLTDNSRLLEWDITADFHELGSPAGIPQLRFCVPHTAKAAGYRYDIPFGAIDREPHAFDVPTNSFAAVLSDQADGALFMLADSKYGFRGDGEELSVNLIRAAYDPDPTPEYGIHRIRLGVGVAGDAAPQTLWRLTAPFMHPLGQLSVRPGKGTLPTTGHLLTAAGAVRVTAIKPAENGDGLIIRLHDTAAGGDYALRFAVPVLSAEQTDLTETATVPLTVAADTVTGVLPKGGLCTLRVRLKNG